MRRTLIGTCEPPATHEGDCPTRAPRRLTGGARLSPMGDTMQAYRIVEWEHAPELVEAPVPEPGPGQVLVAVAGNGLCHSDAMMSQMPGALGEAIGWSVPFTLGHEVGGRVASLGAATCWCRAPASS